MSKFKATILKLWPCRWENIFAFQSHPWRVGKQLSTIKLLRKHWPQKMCYRERGQKCRFLAQKRGHCSEGTRPRWAQFQSFVDSLLSSFSSCCFAFVVSTTPTFSFSVVCKSSFSLIDINNSGLSSKALIVSAFSSLKSPSSCPIFRSCLSSWTSTWISKKC